MTETKNAGELERSQYALQAVNGIQSGMQNALQKMMTGQMTLAQGLKSIWTSVATSIAQVLAQMAAKNIATMLMQAAQGKAIRAKEIMADAKAAAAGAYKAVVGIPVVGPALAPVAAGVAFGGVMAFASAAGGYDIPAGTNPITQLHAREMVLPADLSDRVRNMTGNGGGGVEVVVNNYSNAPATANETSDGRGGRRIEVVVGEMVAGELARPGSAANSSMRNSFGYSPTLARR